MINELTVEDLKERLDKKEIQLIDVREDHEVELCSIIRSIHIPMKIIPKTLHKLSKSIDYAVICHV